MNDNTHHEDPQPEQNGDEQAFDVFGTLAGDYELRRLLGMETPDAVFHVDPELGLTWSIGLTEDDVESCLGRGKLVGDVVEVTFFHAMTESESA